MHEHFEKTVSIRQNSPAGVAHSGEVEGDKEGDFGVPVLSEWERREVPSRPAFRLDTFGTEAAESGAALAVAFADGDGEAHQLVLSTEKLHDSGSPLPRTRTGAATICVPATHTHSH
jgi:hypothetical protein